MNHQWDPKYYVAHSSIQFEHARRLYSQHVFAGTERILDIGCGDGKITAALSQQVPNGKVVGIDKASSMIAFAETQFPRRSFANLAFEKLDAAELAYENEFDVIVSFSCLHFIALDTQPKVLQNIRRALKSDGKLLLMLYRKCPAQWAALDKISNSPPWRSYLSDFTPDFHEYLPDSYQHLLQQAGLGDFTARFTATEYATYDSAERLSEFLKGWLPHLSVIPSELHDVFLMEVVSQYLDNLQLAPGVPVRTPIVRLEIS